MKRTCCSGPWHRPLVGARGAAAGQEKVFTYIRIFTGLKVLGGGARGAGAAVQNHYSYPRREKKFLNSGVCEFEAGGHL